MTVDMPTHRHHNSRSGFTLIESLLVIAIMGALMTIVVVSLNPMRQLAQVRNSQRERSTSTILQALEYHSIDHGGFIFDQIDENLRMLGTAADDCDVLCGEEFAVSACMDLAGVLVNDYMAVMPFDPKVGSLERTYYAVQKLPNGRIFVAACGAELDEQIGSIR